MDKVSKNIFFLLCSGFKQIFLLIQTLLMYIPSTIYDTIISKNLTNYSYEQLGKLIDQFKLKNEGKRLRILDIGVGTAVPLHHIWDSLPKQVDVLGVDIDKSYIQKAKRLFKNIQSNDGSRKIDLRELNLYTMNSKEFGKFDIVIFSSSFMLMPDRIEALKISKELLAKGGKIMFILTLQKAEKKKQYLSRLIEYWKPKLKYILTIDFGQVTYEDDFQKLLKEADLKITYEERLSKSGNIPTKIFRVFLYETQIN